ncbi:MAG TPA: hypothetical protein VIJ19_03060 [Opitutaceae bacterium]
MRNLRFALCALILPLAALRAADDQKEEQQAPEEIPNFNQLDEYIYVPKTTLSLGERYFLRGPRTSYSGQGLNPSTVFPGADSTTPNLLRTYIDGSVSPDSRTVSAPTGEGATEGVPIQSDGRTNTWSYNNASQLLPNGDIAFHAYQAEITDTGVHSVYGEANAGVELMVDRDMGTLGKAKKIKWSITAGFSLGDIHSSSYVSVPTQLTTLTDTYDLFGQVPPAAPFNSPNNISQTVFGAGSTVVSGSGQTSTTQTAQQVILLGDAPINRDPEITNIFTTNRYFIEGSYYTLRVGPTVLIPIGNHFKLTASAGPALIYAGSVLNVLEDLNIATGEDFTQLYQKENSKLLPGYYVDVNLEYQLTDTAGFYVGNIYQSAGSFSQKVSSGPGTYYQTNIDFGNQDGVKGGMTVRF